MPPSRLVCDFNTDAPSFHLAEYFRSAKSGEVLCVSANGSTSQCRAIALRRHNVLRLTYTRKPLLQQVAPPVGYSPVTERTPLNHAVVKVGCSFIASSARSVNVLMSTACEVLQLRCWCVPDSGDWIDPIVCFQLCEYLLVPDRVRVQQFPLFAIALCLCYPPSPDDLTQM